MEKKYLLKTKLMLLLLLFAGSIFAQQVTITGTVTDATDGSSLPGATVSVKGKPQGTITDFTGKYTISTTEGSTLVFSFIGYVSKEVTLAGQTVVDVTLSPAATDIEEVLIIGYGTQKKSDKTGAVANVNANELNGGVITDPIQALQGKTAGVSISKKGGDPNGGFTVVMRGLSSIAAGSSPLFVVDGVPGVDPTTIAPEDIESYNVLKDAASTAIYGSRGANGVVFISTKKGTKNQRNVVEFNSYVSIDNVAKKLDLMTADELRTLANEKGLNLVDGGANTDWQDVIYREGLSQSYNIAAGGGAENSTYRVSLAHADFLGVLRGTEKQRTTARLNLSQSAIDNKLQLQASIAGTFEHNDYENYGGNGSNDIIYQALQRNPTDPVYNADGTFYETQREFQYFNPLAIIEQIQNERDAKRFMGNLKADFEIIKGLTLGANLGYTRDDSESFYFEPSNVRGGGSTGFGSRSYNNMESKILETTLSYIKTISSVHNLNLVAGYSYQREIFDGFSAQGRNPLSNFVTSHNLGVLLDVNKGDVNSYKSSSLLISFFGRATYNFNSKYYLTGTIRRDGSTKFGTNNEWGFFPSVSAGWAIKEEAFLKNVDFVSQLKLRASFGLAGNQNIGVYRDLTNYVLRGDAINPETGEPAFRIIQDYNANENLQWEENTELNIGLDWGIMKNRISGTVEYYNKRTDNLVFPFAVSVPPNLVQTTWGNAGLISNSGIEANAELYLVQGNKFDWKMNISFSKNSQKVIKLSNENFTWTERDSKRGWLSGRGLVGDQNWSLYLQEGLSIGTFYMPEYAGLSGDGKFLYYTAAGGVTRDLTAAERRNVGNAIPDFEIGMSNFFTIYKNFDISFALRALVGNDVLNVTKMVFANPSVLPSLNALRVVRDEMAAGLTDYPRISSYYLEDGSFLRMDNITFGYNFDVTKTNWIKKCRIYVSSNNTFILTNYTGTDPEQNYDGLDFGLDQYNVYPKTRTFTFGVNLTF